MFAVAPFSPLQWMEHAYHFLLGEWFQSLYHLCINPIQLQGLELHLYPPCAHGHRLPWCWLCAASGPVGNMINYTVLKKSPPVILLIYEANSVVVVMRRY